MAIAFHHSCFDQEIHLPRDPDEDLRYHQPIVIHLQWHLHTAKHGAAGFRRDICKFVKRGICRLLILSAGVGLLNRAPVN